jgi:hypothetical protein
MAEMKPGWRKITGKMVVEFAVILVSVYLAVTLERASQDRTEYEQAVEALTQLLGELREDRIDFDRIIGLQDGLDRSYLDLVRWLDTPETMPSDSVGVALTAVWENPTLFPRQASWRMMIASGQLSDLEQPELMLQLGHLYETAYSRLDYHSRFYDQGLSDLFKTVISPRWDPVANTLRTDEFNEIRRLRNDLGWVRGAFSAYYVETLREYLIELNAVIASVEDFLAVA